MSLSDNTEHTRDARDAQDFSGKTVFIMGGTSGINRGIAEAFAAHGGRMAVASRSQEEVAATVDRPTGLGVDAMGFSVSPVTVGKLRQRHRYSGGRGWALGGFSALGAALSELAERARRKG